MARTNAVIVAFNRGLIDKKALARVDLARTALSAEVQTNYVPRSLGSMMLRPGLGYIGATDGNNAAIHIPFVKAFADTAIIEVTEGKMRVRVSEAVVSRTAVSSAVSNGAFGTDLTGWTDADESGATSAWATGGYLSLIGTRYDAAIRRQEVTVAGGDQNVEHALDIVIERGPVTLKVGSSAGTDGYIEETALGTGYHSLAFTPTGNFHIELSNRGQAASLVDSIAVAASGDMELTVPWQQEDLPLIRWDQSADVIFVACDGYRQRRIERRATRSWSVVEYETDDGPFRIVNTSTLRLTPSATSGDITLTASRALFRAGHVGALFRITSVGQLVEQDVTGEGQWSNSIRVTGVGTSRQITITRAGTWSVTVTLQRSIGEEGDWTDVAGQTFTGNGTTTYTDTLDNQIVFYRIGVDTGDYTSGTAELSLEYASGGITGIVRLTAVASGTSASAAVLRQLGGTSASEDWSEGIWSDYRGWPTAVGFYEGRLWWAGKTWLIGSVSDAYESFDDDIEGDSAPIIRTIGSGPVDDINFILPVQRLIVGTASAEISCRSSSFDEPLTPTNFNLKEASTQGSAPIAAAKIDSRGIFVQASGKRVFQAIYEFNNNDYLATDMTLLVPELGASPFEQIVVQRQPDTRVHCRRADGTVAILLSLPAEELLCWIEVETDGVVEDIVVMPGDDESRVYYTVQRTIDGNTVRYLEKWALESECVGGTLNKQADSFVTFTNAPAAASIPAATCSHLVGETVVVWADGKCLTDAAGDIATFTVAANGGIAALTDGGASYTATTGVVGLAYRARYKSTKLAYGAAGGTALAQPKKVDHLGLILANTHPQGFKYGPSFDRMDPMPLIENGTTVDQDTIWGEYDEGMIEFPGQWDTDSRICLESNAPRPATAVGLVIGMQTSG